jgi:hypothetical protein
MFRILGLCFGTLVRLFRGRQSLLLENLACQQLVALSDPFDKLFRVVMIGGASGTLMSRSIRRALRSPSSCGWRSPLKPHKYLVFDSDRKFGFEEIAAVKVTRVIPKRTSFRSPWQNGIAERWVGSCRRDLLGQIVALNERHLKRLLSEYVRYHHEDRTHLGLEKGTTDGRIRFEASGPVLSQQRLGGLHHRYNRAASFGSTFGPRAALRPECVVNFIQALHGYRIYSGNFLLWASPYGRQATVIAKRNRKWTSAKRSVAVRKATNPQPRVIQSHRPLLRYLCQKIMKYCASLSSMI